MITSVLRRYANGKAGQLFALAFFCYPLGVLGIYIKYSQIKLLGGYSMIARFLGFTNYTNVSTFQKASLYYQDILIHFIVLPLLLVLISWVFSTRISFAKIKLTIFYIIVTISVLYYINLQSLNIVGSFVSLNLLTDAIQWAFTDPESSKEYVSVWSIFKFIAYLTMIYLVLRGMSKPKLMRVYSICSPFIILVSALTLIILTKPNLFDKTVVNKSTFLEISKKLFSRDIQFAPEILLSDQQQVLDEYDSIFGSAVSVKNDFRFHSKEYGSDVIVFILETIPYQALNPLQLQTRMAGVSMILKKSFICNMHFTTYPYTRDALFSIFSGLYPIEIEKYYLDGNNPGGESFGLFNLLKASGYISKVYNPLKLSPFAEKRMMKVFGADEVFLAGETPYKESYCKYQVDKILKRLNIYNGMREEFKKKLYHDLMAFSKMKDDIIKFKSRKQRFLAIFLPQISHGPWFKTNTSIDIFKSGHDLALMQLKLLNELIIELEKNKWLQNTLILLTSDHGVRTKIEYPGLQIGFLNSYSFRVPFFLFAPNALSKTAVFNNVTSHVDILPTLLSLLGVEYNEKRFHGIPIWRRQDRNVYFLAKDYCAADGYFDSEEFYMYQYLWDTAYKSRTIDFPNSSILVDQGKKKKLRAQIGKLYQLGRLWPKLFD